MIPQAYITEWRRRAPWGNDAQVEQDLILCRALVSIYSSHDLKNLLAFRGGTALHKLIFDTARRYSEDLDLVQVNAGTRDAIMDALPQVLQPWLGRPRWRQSENRLTYIFRLESEIEPVVPLRLKVEINMSENFAVHGARRRTFEVDSPWHTASAEVLTYSPEELLATKLRALYQRRKGRDLFDLAEALRGLPSLDVSALLDCFHEYLKRGGIQVSRAQFEENMASKIVDRKFNGDVAPLLVEGTTFDAAAGYQIVHSALIARLRGQSWKGLPSAERDR